MQEFMYDINSAWIALALFLTMALAIEAGHRIGLRRHPHAGGSYHSHVNMLAASLLGVLALLLGFTLSLSLQRYDSRSEAVVSEANAIGTAWLRTALLAEPARSETRALLRSYLDLRVQAGAMAYPDRVAQQALVTRTAELQAGLWERAVQATRAEPNAATSGLYTQALNEAFDEQGRREAGLERHVPELVLLLLYVTFLMASGIVGYAAGIGGHRPSLATHIMVTLIVVLVFIVLDLDRPRRGFIQVSQDSLVSLQASVRATAPAGSAPEGHAAH